MLRSDRQLCAVDSLATRWRFKSVSDKLRSRGCMPQCRGRGVSHPKTIREIQYSRLLNARIIKSIGISSAARAPRVPIRPNFGFKNRVPKNGQKTPGDSLAVRVAESTKGIRRAFQPRTRASSL
jgi:hypothetical protein